MRIFSPDDCQQWISYTKVYQMPFKTLMFQPTEEGRVIGISEVLADIYGTTYTHDMDRIKRNIDKLLNNYPKLLDAMPKIDLYVCPYPALDFANATCWGDAIVFWARTTQIPHCMIDYIVGHEFGHVVNHFFCDRHGQNMNPWREYLKLRNAPRGICHVYDHWDEEHQESVYVDKEDYLCIKGTAEQRNTPWQLTPAEWFAEDFRYFFGVDTGEKYWGMPIPEPTQEIKEFISNLYLMK